LSDLCDRILAIDKGIALAMVADEKGKIVCEKTRAGEGDIVPREMVLNLGGLWASVIGGIFKQPSAFLGRLEYAVVKYEKATAVGIVHKKEYVAFVTRQKDAQRLVEKVMEKLV